MLGDLPEKRSDVRDAQKQITLLSPERGRQALAGGHTASSRQPGLLSRPVKTGRYNDAIVPDADWRAPIETCLSLTRKTPSARRVTSAVGKRLLHGGVLH